MFCFKVDNLIARKFSQKWTRTCNVDSPILQATGGNSSAGLANVLETVLLACEALGENLLYWEFGNEADLYHSSGPNPVRPSWWHEPEYVAQWLNGTEAIKSQLDISCPGQQYGWIAPSFAGTQDWLKPLPSWNAGLNNDSDVEIFSHHKSVYLTPTFPTK